MQFVPANQVREGMCVAQDICDPQGRILIARGQRIGTHHLVRMRKFGITNIFIDPSGGEAYVKPTRSELREECEKVLSEAFGNLTKEFAAKRITLNAQAIKQATDRLVDALLQAKNPLVTLLDVSGSSDRLMQHSVNVTVLATVLGIDLRVPEAMLRELAVAMLFHDIGMIFLPDGLMQKSEPLTPEELTAAQQHPHTGFEHLVGSQAISSVSANLILRHHELLNGTGYPQRIGGEKLSLLTRIASVVEAYDSLTTPRFGVPAVLPDVAVSYLLANAGKLFAKEAVVALCRRIALYPQGTAVKLNTGECGIVAGVLATAPMRPVVLVQIDHRGKPLKEPLIVDLTCDASRNVVRSAANLQLLLQTQEPETAPAPIHPVYANLG